MSHTPDHPDDDRPRDPHSEEPAQGDSPVGSDDSEGAAAPSFTWSGPGTAPENLIPSLPSEPEGGSAPPPETASTPPAPAGESGGPGATAWAPPGAGALVSGVPNPPASGGAAPGPSVAGSAPTPPGPPAVAPVPTPPGAPRTGAGIGAGIGIGCAGHAVGLLLMIGLISSALGIWGALWPFYIIAALGIAGMFFRPTRPYATGVLIVSAAAWLIVLGPCVALLGGLP